MEEATCPRRNGITKPATARRRRAGLAAALNDPVYVTIDGHWRVRNRPNNSVMYATLRLPCGGPESKASALRPASTIARSSAGRLITVAQTWRLGSKALSGAVAVAVAAAIGVQKMLGAALRFGLDAARRAAIKARNSRSLGMDNNSSGNFHAACNAVGAKQAERPERTKEAEPLPADGSQE